MLTRIGDLAQHGRVTDFMLGAQARTRAMQIQISTGKVAHRFQDVAAEASQLLRAKDVLQRVQQFQSNNSLVDQRLQVMESSLASLFEVGSRIKVLLIQRLDSGAGVPGTMAPEADQLLKQAAAELNVAFDGRHLFAGSKTQAPPVVLDPTFAAFGAPDDTFYQGDDVILSVLADEGREIGYGMTADREGFHELIGGLRAALEGDLTNDRAMLEDALALVTEALPKIAEYRSQIGARQAALGQINLGLGEMQLYLEHQIGGIEDVDIAEAITRLSQDQMVLEATMATVARLSQLSLADFLR
jgi:flagellar hook-associated protein 3 FlgL